MEKWDIEAGQSRHVVNVPHVLPHHFSIASLGGGVRIGNLDGLVSVGATLHTVAAMANVPITTVPMKVYDLRRAHCGGLPNAQEGLPRTVEA